MKKTVPSIAAKTFVASALAFACAPALVACGGAAAPGASAKYYDIIDFVNADGASQLAELKAEGFGYFDQKGAWSWGGTPEDNVANGPAWVILHKADADEEGWTLMTKSDVENNVEVDWADLSWSELSYQKDNLPAKVKEIVEKCGLPDLRSEGWSLGDTSYVAVGACQIEGQDAYWTVEATPVAVEEGADPTATLRIAVYQLNDTELDDVVSSLVPTEEDRQQYEQTIAEAEAAAGDADESAATTLEIPPADGGEEAVEVPAE